MFAFDTASSSVELLSPSATGGTSGNGASERPVPSRDGRTVVFLSRATDLVTGWRDANTWPTSSSQPPPLDHLATDVFVRHRDSATTELVSRSNSGSATGDRGSTNAVISKNGATVVFESEASDLVAGLAITSPSGGPCCLRNVFAYRLSTAEMRAVSLDDAQPLATLRGASIGPAVTADGRYVAFSWRYWDWSYLAARRSLEPPLPLAVPPVNGPGHATFIRPTNGATNVDTSQPFSWSPAPGAAHYLLSVGTTKGGYDLVNSGALPSTQTTYAVPALPAGRTLWARVYSYVGGNWDNVTDVSFTAAPAR